MRPEMSSNSNTIHDSGCPLAATAVAIDNDKASPQAVKWAADHLLQSQDCVVLLHVKTKTHDTTAEIISEMPTQKGEDDMSQLFLPLRGFCARKDIKVMEVVLEDIDICKAIVNYINVCSIQNIVLGASTRSSLIKKFRSNSTDLATNITKLAPDFCAVYVIQKGRPATIRKAKSPPPPPSLDSDDSIR
ncbi:U-box domain-containing protein 51-like [Curcuma longa]|uniref:U-box domain-containing protein 51-like n=1 Tax=Curcuma longa TaxID=136217 RepID=UPI003D9DC064